MTTQLIDTPEVITLGAQQTAVIRLIVPRAQIQEAMGPARVELLEVLAAQGIAPTGPMFTHHFRMDPELFDFEVGLPVNEAVRPAGRVQPASLPGGRVARTTYRGRYEELGRAWGALMEWMRSQGHAAAPELWEAYVAGPEVGADPGLWRTELYRPLV